MGNFIAFTEIGKIYISSAKWKGDISTKISRLVIDISTEMASEIQFVFMDPGLKMLKEKKIPLGASVKFQGEKMVVSAIEVDGGVSGTGAVSITCRSRLIDKLKKRKGKYVRKSTSPTSFIRAEIQAVGGKFVGQTTKVRKQISRDIVEKKDKSTRDNSAWTTIQRLAQEEGFIAFESEGTVYFGKPTWLTKNRQKHTVKYGVSTSNTDKHYAAMTPNCRQSVDDHNVATLSLRLPKSRFSSIQVGEVIKLSGMGMFSRSYLVNSKTFVDSEDTFELAAETPDDPQKTNK